MRFSPFAKQIALTILTLNLMVVSAVAVAPTREAVEKWKTEGVWEQKVANWKAFKKAGGCAPEVHSVFNKEKHRQNLALGIQTVDTVNVIVILVDFDDWPYDSQAVAGTPADFDSILFSNNNPTGSMTDYYLENSYGRFYIKGDIFGWYRMDSTYEWYVSDDDGLTRGRYLAADAVDAAEADGVDFSEYDHDDDGYCDGVIIIHAGRGAEDGVYGIWSHKWNIYPARYYDGVTISAYTMNPEETWFPMGIKLSPIGVFCHEYGHILG
ncbi:MAG: M6 family metalloprotease domain-containing protein, partial [Candidatus Zixiibacteriota bacterium]